MRGRTEEKENSLEEEWRVLQEIGSHLEMDYQKCKGLESKLAVSLKNGTQLRAHRVPLALIQYIISSTSQEWSKGSLAVPVSFILSIKLWPPRQSFKQRLTKDSYKWWRFSFLPFQCSQFPSFQTWFQRTSGINSAVQRMIRRKKGKIHFPNLMCQYIIWMWIPRRWMHLAAKKIIAASCNLPITPLPPIQEQV